AHKMQRPPNNKNRKNMKRMHKKRKIAPNMTTSPMTSPATTTTSQMIRTIAHQMVRQTIPNLN
ncbi:unnamed protein product, partial [Aphanomyces euteiches]